MYSVARVFKGAGLGLVLILCCLSLAKGDQCITCHANPDFRVSNKKLFDYYLNYSNSIHMLAGVVCTDCHGGNDRTNDPEMAHRREDGTKVGAPVRYQQIAQTCGNCHADVFDEFQKSRHFQALGEEVNGLHGPNCVTCHGSLNSHTIKSNAVAEVCRQCHTESKIGFTDVPHRAEALLSDFITINRFARYIMHKGNNEQVASFRSDLEPRIQALILHWHRFDLDNIELETRAILLRLKDQKNLVLHKSVQQRKKRSPDKEED